MNVGDNATNVPFYGAASMTVPVYVGTPGARVLNLDRRVQGVEGSLYVIDGWEWLDSQWMPRITFLLPLPALGG
ncbi:MAG TPA: hypothetical protein PKA20_25000 [Burkholderiaceae bacterium]|nr:hypothetical protein [Burkholderiaceae bacterium]